MEFLVEIGAHGEIDVHDGKTWRILKSQYDRVVETVSPIDENIKFTKYMLKDKGLKI